MIPSISVVTPILVNSAEKVPVVHKYLSIAKSRTRIPFTFIIVETESDLFKQYADIHIYELERSDCNISLNRGFSCCRSDYVVMLTDDVLVPENWIELLLEPFDKFDDCGASTLATDQFFHVKQDKIEEGVWFSVGMVRREDAWFDEKYRSSWGDTDLVMRIYERGQKMYRNFGGIAKHLVGNTEYKKSDHNDNFYKNKMYFSKKWYNANCQRMFNILMEGPVL